MNSVKSLFDGKLVSITDKEVRDELRRIIEDESDLIVEHRFLRGSRAPFRFVCADYDILEKYLAEKAGPGDAFYIWKFEECCTSENFACRGKVPTDDGSVPSGGVY